MEKALGLAATDLRVQTNYAQALYERRLVLKAWLRLQQVMAQDQNYVPARLLKATLCLDEELPRKAEEETAWLIEKDSENALAQALHAECKAVTGHPDEAESLVQRAIVQHGQTRPLQLALALARRARGDQAGATTILKSLDDRQVADRVTVRVSKLLAS
jgi:predicted Zn-dependent protease